jgi:hypothetical protein
METRRRRRGRRRDGDRPCFSFPADYIYIYSQKAVLRNKSARIKWALCFSIAIIQPKFMKNRQISIDGGSSR